MNKELIILVSEKEKHYPKYTLLFGKYSVSRVNDYSDSMTLWVGEPDNLLAILDVTKDETLHLHADYARNSPAADLDKFKQLYKDAKEHFSRAGVRINTPRTHKVFPGLEDYADSEFPDFGQDFEQLRKLERMQFPASFLTTLILMGYQKEPKLTTKEIAKQVYESVDAYLINRFPEQKEEIVPYGSLGSISNGSKIWTIKPGVYVIFEAPMFDDSPWPINMQINADETHPLEEVLGLRRDMKNHIISKFDVQLFDNPETRHFFDIDLSDLNKRKLNCAVESPRISNQ